jgi:hypothetical protein
VTRSALSDFSTVMLAYTCLQGEIPAERMARLLPYGEREHALRFVRCMEAASAEDMRTICSGILVRAGLALPGKPGGAP